MSEVEPVAYRWTYDLGQAWNIGPNKPTDFRFGEPDEIQPLVRLTDAEERIRELQRERYELAYAITGGEDAPGLLDSIPVDQLVEIARGNHRSMPAEIDRSVAAEARAEAAEALLKEAGKHFSALIDDLEMRAVTLPNGTKQVAVSDGVYHRARSIAAKIGGKDE